MVALEGLLPSTLKAVVIHLVKGTWHEDVKFCPRPPELANMVRDEQRRVEAANRQRLPAPAAVAQPFKDLRVTHRLRSEELQRLGFTFHDRCQSHEAFAALAKRRAVPVGSVHLWAIDEIWVPKQVKAAMPPEQEPEIPFEDEAAA